MLQDTKENRLDILRELGWESFKKKDYIKAIIYYQRYLDIDDADPLIHNTLGYIYRKLSKYENLDKQIECFERALSLKPDYVQALRNLALTYPHVGRYDEAIGCFHRIFELEPVNDDYVVYGCLKIKLKDFEEGWKFYEYRFNKEYTPTEYPEFVKPRWQGQEIKDKVLLIQYEQGFGDSLQFCRYINLVKPLAKKIIFRVQDELKDLMQLNFKDAEVVGESTPTNELEFDYHIALLSLVYVLNADVESIPYAEGYLKADEKKIKKYKKEFFNNDKIKIGISWHGAKFGNPYRNVLLKYFYPLAKLENVQVYSFQKSFGREQLKKVPKDIEIINLGETFDDFSDTAAAMANLDLFVTSDNGVFNLAGAMGVKTCLLLNAHSEWRWFLDDKTTPWYKNVKVFKKSKEEQTWAELIKKVVEKFI